MTPRIVVGWWDCADAFDWRGRSCGTSRRSRTQYSVRWLDSTRHPPPSWGLDTSSYRTYTMNEWMNEWVAEEIHFFHVTYLLTLFLTHLTNMSLNDHRALPLMTRHGDNHHLTRSVCFTGSGKSKGTARTRIPTPTYECFVMTPPPQPLKDTINSSIETQVWPFCDFFENFFIINKP